MACAFCAIASGALDAAIVVADGAHVAFLDARPLFPGHVLIVPRAHVETLGDLAPDAVEPLFALVRRVAAAMPGALGCDGTFVAINNRVSQSVPHLHVHVVPRRKGDGLRGFFWPRTKYADDGDREAVRVKLAAALAM